MRLRRLHEEVEISFVGGLDDVDQSVIDAGYALFDAAGLRAARAEELYAVAMDDGEVVGAVTVAIADDKFIFSVAIAEGRRRQGIGKRLIDAVIADARSVDMAEVSANVVNPHLLDYLKSIGFEHENVGGQDWAFLSLK